MKRKKKKRIVRVHTMEKVKQAPPRNVLIDKKLFLLPVEEG